MGGFLVFFHVALVAYIYIYIYIYLYALVCMCQCRRNDGCCSAQRGCVCFTASSVGVSGLLCMQLCTFLRMVAGFENPNLKVGAAYLITAIRLMQAVLQITVGEGLSHLRKLCASNCHVCIHGATYANGCKLVNLPYQDRPPTIPVSDM